MKQLWAPWRMSYIRGHEDEKIEMGCIFCLRDRSEEDRQRQVLLRGRQAFVIMNRFPYTNGHLMVAPFRHTADLPSLTVEETLEMQQLISLSIQVMKDTIAPQGFNIGMNLGRVAGAGVDDHLHMHIVPRWSGDTNFMPVFSDVRVIPEHLEETYQILAESFSRLSID